MRKLTQEEFVEKFNAVHGTNRYDLSNAKYDGAAKKIEVICPKHGPWMAKPNNLLSGQGCPKCGQDRTAESRRLTQEDFLSRVCEIHGENCYDLSRAKYTGGKDKVEVICHTHGAWLAYANGLLAGHGCPKCGVEKAIKSLTLTQEEFEERVRDVHGNNRYDLSKARYVNNHTKVEVLCPTHGYWMITPNNLFRGNGCPKCGQERTAKSKRITQEEFEEKVEAVHGKNRYDLSHAKYTGNKNKVEVICPKHGSWQASPSHLFKGVGCPKCGLEKISESTRLTQDEFLARAKAVHGDNRYDLSRVNYVDTKSKVEVVCPKHGSWLSTPGNFLYGYGCPKCGHEKVIDGMRLTQEEFLARVKSVHKDKFNFSRVRYVSFTDKVEVICPVHGPWRTLPGNLLRGCGCPKCKAEKASERLFLTQEEFESRISAMFGEKADFSSAVYSGTKARVTMRCTEHDIEFEAPADSLFAGAWGCPSCINNGKSKGEESVAEYIESLGVKVERGRRDVIPPKEIDIFIPAKNLAIEYNGVYYHHDGKKPRNYHRDKYLACKEKGIRLIQILDLGWETRQDQIKSLLANALGARANEKKVNARSCEVRQVKVGELREFFDGSHIQGHCGTGSLALALFFEDEIVAAMVFGKGTNQRGAARAGREGEWTLSRYATSCVVRGGFGKLLAYGRGVIGWEHDIVSYSANDYFDGRVYEAAGFELDAEIAPDYQVYHPRNGLRPKSHWQRRHIPARLAEIGWDGDFDPDTDPRTEWELEDQVGAVRVYDSGKRRWRLRGVDKSHRAV